MQLGQIYKMIVEMGIDADPRGREKVNKVLEKSKKAIEKLEGKKRELADMNATWNPYTDCRLLYGDENREIKSVLSGIDITPGEIVLADRLADKGDPIELV